MITSIGGMLHRVFQRFNAVNVNGCKVRAADLQEAKPFATTANVCFEPILWKNTMLLAQKLAS